MKSYRLDPDENLEVAARAIIDMTDPEKRQAVCVIYKGGTLFIVPAHAGRKPGSVELLAKDLKDAIRKRAA